MVALIRWQIIFLKFGTVLTFVSAIAWSLDKLVGQKNPLVFTFFQEGEISPKTEFLRPQEVILDNIPFEYGREKLYKISSLIVVC